MPAEQRDVVLWRELHEETWHAIAERLGRRTIGAVRHLHGVACGELLRSMKLRTGVACLQ